MTPADPNALAMPPAAPAVPATSRGLSLRLRIHLIVAGLMALCVAVLLWLQIDATRRSVHEEITGANKVATQLLQQIGRVYTRAGSDALLEFLQQLGRVRANDIRLIDAGGRELYRSPPSTYKSGLSAPDWYAALVVPELQRQVIQMPGLQLTVDADPSRAIRDGWDDFRVMAGTALVAAAALLLGVFWLVGRALRPFPTIVALLARLERGELGARLPPLPGREAASIGAAINRMSAAVEAHVAERLRAFEVERTLAESRELARQLEHHIEAERREIARELHDELGQSVTAIRSLAASLKLRLKTADPTGSELAALIGAEALRLDNAMHGLIPRLAPLTLDHLSLADSLSDLIAAARQREPGVQIALRVQAPLPPLHADTALAAYRMIQEALTNALRHSGAGQIEIQVGLDREDAAADLLVSVSDDGCGLGGDGTTAPAGRYGLRGLRERVRGLGGRLELAPAHAAPACADAVAGHRPGLCVRAWLPLQPAGTEAAA